VVSRTLVIIDNFLGNPDEMRELALKQTYVKMGSAGKRSTQQFHRLIPPAEFGRLLDITVEDWNRYPINGRFQICTAEDPLVFHADAQRWAGVIFLTPDAPVECGLTLVRSRATGARRSTGNAATDALTFDGKLLDSTKWETIDRIGNVYNRLVLWDAQHIHAAASYFGTDLRDGRLFWMFFFDGA